MLLKYMRVYNFRNYDSFELYPNPNITVIYGKNGSGKTNLLEAVHFCCFARSQRTRQDKDLIRIGETQCAAGVNTTRKDGNHSVEIHIENVAGRTIKTPFVYGKRLEKISEIFGHCSCVLFAPEDMSLIKGGPQERRRFADMQISQLNGGYLRNLSMYLNAVKNRNALLRIEKLRGKIKNERHLDTWEGIMSEYGKKVTSERDAILKDLNEEASKIYSDISVNLGEKLEIKYISNIGKIANYDEALKECRETDMNRGGTSYGPHKDDVNFFLNGNDMRDYASQGQIRTAVLAVKLAMISIIDRYMNEKPILLLDDVFSELDARRRAALMEYIAGIQSFISCANKDDLQMAKADSFLHVENIDGLAKVSEG